MGILASLGGTGMLSGMKYVNIRHELPEIGIRQQQAASEKAAYVPAEMHRDYEPPKADMGWSQIKVDINCYPCRKALGHLSDMDFARKYGQQGYSDVQAATSKHTNEGWDMARNGARPGRDVLTQQEWSKFWDKVIKWPQWTIIDIPDPEFTVTPSELTGQMNVGHDKYNIQTYARADVAISPGEAETYLAKEGSIRMWATEGRLDIYA